jgi:CRISPR type III-A-associated protein Csm2
MTRYPQHGRGGGGGGVPNRGGRGPDRGGGTQQHDHTAAIAVLFDPNKSDTELFDTLAEQQAKVVPEGVNSSQLRRYFGELKGLYNQFRSLTAGEMDPAARQQVYRDKIESRFKMLRSKLAYGRRPGARGALQPQFSQMLESGIAKVSDAKTFERFVLHIEAVVGFMYGNEKVKK